MILSSSLKQKTLFYSSLYAYFIDPINLIFFIQNRLLSMLEEYIELREEKEQERRRKRVLILPANDHFNQSYIVPRITKEQCLLDFGCL